MITAEGYEGFFRNDNEVLGFWPIFPGYNSRQWVLEKSDSRKTYTSFCQKMYMFSQKHVRLFSTTSKAFFYSLSRAIPTPDDLFSLHTLLLHSYLPNPDR